jgi:broad specificity phosphatase PhoE
VPADQDTLTWLGREQAQKLGKDWAEVGVDAIYTSTLSRAKDTALAIAEHNRCHPKITEWESLKEHDHGPRFEELMKQERFDAAHRERSGPSFQSDAAKRQYCPTGGESLDDLVSRGIHALRKIILSHGVELSTLLEKMSPEQRKKSIDELPHIAIVSHNIFLSELWEAMKQWDEPMPRDMGTNYDNASW